MTCRFCKKPTEYNGPCRTCGGSYRGPSPDTPDGEAIDYWFKEAMVSRAKLQAIRDNS